MDATTGHSKLHSESEDDRLSRYSILSHHAGIRFFSPESYPEALRGTSHFSYSTGKRKNLLENMMSVWTHRMFFAFDFLHKTASKFLSSDIMLSRDEENFHALIERNIHPGT